MARPGVALNVIASFRSVLRVGAALLLLAGGVPAARAQSGAAVDSAPATPTGGGAPDSAQAPPSGGTPAAAPQASATPAPKVKPVTFYTAWRAPWGTPRATDHLVVPCTDEEVRDTLWLTFEPGRDTTVFGMIGEVYFRAQPGDTLGPMWWFGGGAMSDVNILMEWPKPTDRTWQGAGIPWTTNGFGAAHYDRTPGSGRLKIVFAVSADSPGHVQAGKRYAFARLLIMRGKTDKERCNQPICIEWGGGGVTFDIAAGEEEATRVGGNRFVTWNSRNRHACDEYSGTNAPRPWTPKPGTH